MSAICLGDVYHRSLRVLLGNRCFTKAICAIGTTATKIKTTTNTCEYSIDGQLYEKAATDDLFVFTDVTSQDDLTTCFYALCLDSALAATIVNGTPQLTAAVTAGTADALLPEVSDSVCMIGAVKVVTSGAAFVPGTTALSAGTVTDEYYNLSCAPIAGHP